MDIPTVVLQPVKADVTYERLIFSSLKTRPRLLNQTLTFHLILLPTSSSPPSPRRHARCSVTSLCCLS